MRGLGRWLEIFGNIGVDDIKREGANGSREAEQKGALLPFAVVQVGASTRLRIYNLGLHEHAEPPAWFANTPEPVSAAASALLAPGELVSKDITVMCCGDINQIYICHRLLQDPKPR